MSGEVEPDPNDAVIAELYWELRERAQRYLRGRKNGSMHPTLLVHEAYLKLKGCDSLDGADRGHLLAVASKAMRCVLVDRARARRRVKRDPRGERVSLEEIEAAYEERAVDLVALDAALEKLRGFDPEMSRAIDLVFFGGLTRVEAAEAVPMKLRTLERHWKPTLAFLLSEMR